MAHGVVVACLLLVIVASPSPHAGEPAAGAPEQSVRPVLISPLLVPESAGDASLAAIPAHGLQLGPTPAPPAGALMPQAPPAQGPAKQLTPAAREGIGLFMAFTLGVLLLFTVLVLALTLRRQQRRLDGPARGRGQGAGEEAPDPWLVSAQRMPVPLASELETRTPGGAEETSRAAASQAGGSAAGPGGLPVGMAELPKGAIVRTPVGAPVALITAGGRRVGRAIALELARCGCDVIVTYHHSDEAAQQVAREVAALGRQATTYRVDLSSMREVEAFAGQLAQVLPRLDVLVHNASTYAPSPLQDLRAEDALEHFSVNALAPLLLTARLLPLLRESRLPALPCVVALADIHAMQRPRRDLAAYTMSKAALQEMVACLARDLAPHVRVNGVAPGVVAWPQDMDEREREVYLRRIPLSRSGTPEEAARAVRWLALEASYVTGQILRVDGGRWLT